MFRWILTVMLLSAAAAQAQPAAQESLPGDPGEVWSGYSGLTLAPESARWAQTGLLDGDLIYSGDVTFGRTGRLTDPVDLGWSGGFRQGIPAGSAVYARSIRAGFARSPQFAWCVIGGAAPDEVFTSPTACMLRHGDDRVTAYWMDPAGAPFTLHSRSDRQRGRSRPGIAEEAGLFAPLYTETLQYQGTERGRLIVSMIRRSGEVEHEQGRLQLAIDAQGQAIVRYSGGAWRITPPDSDDGMVGVELLSAPVPPQDYAAALGSYVRFMVERVGSVDWMLGSPASPSLFDMQRNGFIWGETAPEDGRRLRDTPLPPPLGDPAAAQDPDRPAYSTDQGHVLLEITDAPVLNASGVAERGDVIAIHQLRTRQAITIDTPLDGINQNFEAGAVFGPLVLGAEHNTEEPPADMSRLAWCDMRPGRRTFSTGNLDCFIDTDGDGALDLAVMGDPQVDGVGVTLGRLRERRVIEPHAYRKADPTQFPLAELGYRYCEGDNISGPARFSPVYRAAGDNGWSGTRAACSLGVWNTQDDRSRVDAGALVLAIQPTANGIAYEVVERLAAEPVYVFGDGEAPEPIAGLGTRVEQVQAEHAALSVSPLLALGTPDVREGEFADRAPFATLDVRHGITGRLLNVVSQTSGWFRGVPLPVGTPVYGVPMGNFTNNQIIWCAPQRTETGWDTVCLPRSGAITYWLTPSNAFYNTRLSFRSDSQRASVPEVSEEPVEFDFDLRIEVFLLEWDREDADIRASICSGTECSIIRSLSASRASDGSVEVNVFGHRLRLREVAGGDRRTAAVEIVSRPDEYYDPEFHGLTREALQGVRD